MRFDHRAAIAATPAREPSERTFGIVHRDADVTKFGCDLALRQNQMLSAECIDRWPLLIRRLRN